MLYLLEVGKCESNKNDTKEPSEASPESHDGFLYQRLKAPRGDGTIAAGSRMHGALA